MAAAALCVWQDEGASRATSTTQQTPWLSSVLSGLLEESAPTNPGWPPTSCSHQSGVCPHFMSFTASWVSASASWVSLYGLQSVFHLRISIFIGKEIHFWPLWLLKNVKYVNFPYYESGWANKKSLACIIFNSAFKHTSEFLRLDF